jgi:hypothetical protein
VILQSRTEAFFGLNLLQDRRPEHYGLIVDQSYRQPTAAASGPVDGLHTMTNQQGSGVQDGATDLAGLAPGGAPHCSRD